MVQGAIGSFPVGTSTVVCATSSSIKNQVEKSPDIDVRSTMPNLAMLSYSSSESDYVQESSESELSEVDSND